MLLLLVSPLVAAECSPPTAPSLPDGAVSDLQTMVDGQAAVKTYVSSTEAFLACLDEEEAAAGDEEAAEAKMARLERYNAAVDEMESVANTFNEEIREFKAKPAE